MSKTIHNPDQYMKNLREILAQGRKSLGFLLGAGVPASLLVDKDKRILKEDGEALIPMISDLTKIVIEKAKKDYGVVIDGLIKDLTGSPNIEKILTRVRSLADVLGSNKVHGLDSEGFKKLEKLICESIGEQVSVKLPREFNAYLELSGWIGGTYREKAVEIFTTNYDLLVDEAFERNRIPFFDGFSGTDESFFDPVTIANNDLPSRWVRLWKLHGSLGWDTNSFDEIIRGKNKSASKLIFPSHLKYDQTQKLPYSALIERLRNFIQTPDSLLLTCGFSFRDSHLKSVIEEALSSSKSAAVIAFQVQNLKDENAACEIAKKNSNMSVYAKDGAVINLMDAPWQPGELPHPEWGPIRASYWENSSFILGNFPKLARYIALTRAEHENPIFPMAKPHE